MMEQGGWSCFNTGWEGVDHMDPSNHYAIRGNGNDRAGWPGWDVTEALIPQAEMAHLIVELRSATSGVGWFEASFSHLAELTGHLATKVVEKRKAEAA